MTTTVPTPPAAAPDYDSTLVVAIDISDKAWVVGAQVPGLAHLKAKRSIAPNAAALWEALEQYGARAKAAGRTVTRTLVIYESGHTGFWLARWLGERGIEVYVVQPSSIPVNRCVRRAKSDTIDVDLMLRTLLAWLRGEPRVCSMVPVPDEATEDGRRPGREREELVSARLALTNRIRSILATLGIADYEPLPGDRRARLGALRTPLGRSLPPHAQAQVERLLDRLELVLEQISQLETQRDTVLAAAVSDPGEQMIQDLVRLRGIGAQGATTLVREGFVRTFRNAKALGSYVGLAGTPFNSGGSVRDQGISRAGNARLRTIAVELAWLWRRHQPDSALTRWFVARLGTSKGRMRKILLIALARKLLIALWKYQPRGSCPRGPCSRPRSGAVTPRRGTIAAPQTGEVASSRERLPVRDMGLVRAVLQSGAARSKLTVSRRRDHGRDPIPPDASLVGSSPCPPPSFDSTVPAPHPGHPERGERDRGSSGWARKPRRAMGYLDTELETGR
jgi:transposase